MNMKRALRKNLERQFMKKYEKKVDGLLDIYVKHVDERKMKVMFSAHYIGSPSIMKVREGFEEDIVRTEVSEFIKEQNKLFIEQIKELTNGLFAGVQTIPNFQVNMTPMRSTVYENEKWRVMSEEDAKSIIEKVEFEGYAKWLKQDLEQDMALMKTNQFFVDENAPKEDENRGVYRDHYAVIRQSHIEFIIDMDTFVGLLKKGDVSQ